MIKRRIVLGIIGVLAVGIGAGLLHRAGSQPQEEGSGTPEERALATAVGFLKTAGVPIPTADVSVKFLSESWRMQQAWEIRWRGMATVEVTADTSRVIAFTNNWRILQQVRRIDRTGRVIFATKADAQAYLARLARSLGVPEAARLEGVSYHADDTPGRGDANRAGSAVASFRLDAHGYPFVAPGGPGSVVEVDPQDGMLVRYWASYEHVTMPSSPPMPPKLTRSEAEDLAAKAYLAHTKAPRRRAPAPTDAKLGWVSPDPSYGSGHKWSAKLPWSVRLAWVVYFGADAVFIDPYDGSVLGGIQMKESKGSSGAHPVGMSRGPSPSV